ncbi:hypothetical protein K490DRAFT_74115 [Saccharata proteae CBS 121410]|uniref:PLC-like phosphodiesterase n=1 Tax=Saccharata proteae CBS 121410 TaxID=1314787 RepID=A0A9P4HWJ4_9PEZI|nr:hypothetical protein K490DRAFT_74115 [Saccharata proteae CBS 121410]
MPSKGIDVYSFVAVPGYRIEFSVPGTAITHDSNHNFTTSHLEVESGAIPGRTHFVGRFSWRALNEDGVEVASGFNDVNALTGNLAAGNMQATAHQFSIVSDEVVVSYGFYDAGHGEAGLTSHHQCYVTVVSTLLHQNWMARIAPPGSENARKPFSRFALAAPHDDGMNSMETCHAVLDGRGAETVAKLVEHLPAVQWLAEHMSHTALAHLLPNIIYGVAITQKDSMPTMLSLGARYFEFRPANLVPMFQDVAKLQNKPYFQHACIPGLGFDAFLDQLVAFLDANPYEHVVVHLRWDNVVSECKRPTPEEIGAALDAACAKASQNGPLSWGDASCFDEPIDSLRAAGKRIICVVDAQKYDSWTADAYATLSADSILERFEGMTTEGQLDSDITVLQCQATSQSIKEVVVYSILAANADTSCLTSTKAALDMRTLPWVRENAVERLKAEKLLVVMNDFIDGATTDTVIELNKKRFAEP